MIKIHLEELLEQNNMTIRELSTIINITPANISILKNNHAKAIKVSTIEALCKVFNCTPGDLITYEEY